MKKKVFAVNSAAAVIQAVCHLYTQLTPSWSFIPGKECSRRRFWTDLEKKPAVSYIPT